MPEKPQIKTKVAKNPVLEQLEISASISAKIPIAQFENYQPYYHLKETWNTKDGTPDVKKRIEGIQEFLRTKLQGDYEKVEIERIERTKENIRFYDRGNTKYPSVTSIIHPEGIDYDPVLLEQYASRGTIVHKQAEIYIQEKKAVLANKKLSAEQKKASLEKLKLVDPHTVPELEQDVIVVEQGSLELDWEDCDFAGFEKKHGKDFSWDELEKKVFSDTYKYAGRVDCVGTYKKDKAIIDFKTASNYDKKKLGNYLSQLAAYAYTQKDVKVLVLVPLNPSNKCGYGAPMITKNIDKYFNKFLQSRRLFKKMYGV